VTAADLPLLAGPAACSGLQWDDALAHLHFQAVVLPSEARTGFNAWCHEAWAVLTALKAAHREPRPPDYDREKDEDPPRDEDGWLFDQRTEAE